MVIGDQGQGVGAVVVDRRAIDQAKECGIHLGRGPGNGHTGGIVRGDGRAAASDGLQRAMQHADRGTEIIDPANTGIDEVVDADRVGRAKGQRAVLVHRLRRRHLVDRRIVDRLHRDGDGLDIKKIVGAGGRCRTSGHNPVAVDIAGVAEVIGAHGQGIRAGVVQGALVTQGPQGGIECAQVAGDGDRGGTIGGAIGKGQSGRAAKGDGAVAHRQGHQQRAEIGIDRQRAVHAIGVGYADPADGQGLFLNRNTCTRHRDDRRIIDRDNLDIEDAGRLPTATAVGQGKIEGVGRPLQPVMPITDAIIIEVVLGKGAAHPEDGAIEQQLTVLHIRRDTELDLWIGIIRVGPLKVRRGNDPRVSLIEGLSAGQAGIVQNHRIEGARHHVQGHGPRRTDAQLTRDDNAFTVIGGELEAVVEIIGAVLNISKVAGRQIGLADERRGHVGGVDGHPLGAVKALQRTVGRQRGDMKTELHASGLVSQGAGLVAGAIDIGQDDGQVARSVEDIGRTQAHGAGRAHTGGRGVVDRGGVDAEDRLGQHSAAAVGQREAEAGNEVLTAVVGKGDSAGVNVGLGEGAAEGECYATLVQRPIARHGPAKGKTAIGSGSLQDGIGDCRRRAFIQHQGQILAKWIIRTHHMYNYRAGGCMTIRIGHGVVEAAIADKRVFRRKGNRAVAVNRRQTVSGPGNGSHRGNA